MACPRAQALQASQVESWCREESSPTARKTMWNLVRELFRQGESEAGLVWWLREEDRVLGRLLLARDGGGLRVGFLRLPWEGAWSGSLRRLVEAACKDARRRGAAFVEVPEEALELDPPAALGERLAELGFVEQPPVCTWHVRRLRTARPTCATLPEGAEVDGDEARWVPRTLTPERLSLGLEALASHGVQLVVLEWPGEARPGGLGPDWHLEEELLPRRWRLALNGDGVTAEGPST